jgi:DNA-binding winged helix-turn-helix (wHTH) protein
MIGLLAGQSETAALPSCRGRAGFSLELHSRAMRLTIGAALLDTDRRELIRGGERIHLSPKAYELLVLLVEKRPKAVSRSEIQDVLWPRTFVVESNLRTLVTEVRDALGDDGRRPTFIRTVHRFGYAFSGEPSAASGAHVGTHRPEVVHRLVGDLDAELVDGENVLGRDRDAQVRVSGGATSRRHASVVVDGATATLEDLGSKNGTFLNGARVTTPVTLADGDQVRIGSLFFTYHTSSPVPSTRTQASTSSSKRAEG